MIGASWIAFDRRHVLGLVLAGFGAMLWSGGAAAEDSAVLARIKDKTEIRLAYREDAAPFSYLKDGRPDGYSVNLCLEVVSHLQKEMNLPALKIAFIPVTAENRFETIAKGEADLLCEASTATLARRELVDFSISTFVSGASLAIRPDGPTSAEGLGGKRIGVLGGTTTQADLARLLEEQNVTAEVVVAKTHNEGFDLLKRGEIAAYFADRTILQDRLWRDPAGAELLLADSYLTIEPYALAMPIDHGFRLAVDRALSHLFRTGGLIKVFRKSFPQEAKPSDLLKALSRMSGLPE